jgi:hypothetical protein
MLNKQKCHFLNKNGEQEGKTSPVWGVGTSGRGRYKERGWEGEYCENIMHICM